MTPTATDTARLLDVLTGFDSRDWAALPPPTGSFLDGLDDGVRGLRVALPREVRARERLPCEIATHRD